MITRSATAGLPSMFRTGTLRKKSFANFGQLCQFLLNKIRYLTIFLTSSTRIPRYGLSLAFVLTLLPSFLRMDHPRSWLSLTCWRSLACRRSLSCGLVTSQFPMH